MTKQYLDECVRLYVITDGVEGVYEDPKNEDMLVINANGIVGSIPKDVMTGLQARISKEIERLENEYSLANQKFLSAKTSIMKMHWQGKCAGLRREINRMSGRND